MIAALCFVVSWLGTLAVRAYAIRSAMLDIPNHRSSHTIPTPRGGGLAVVVSFGLGLVALTLSGSVGQRECAAFILAGGIVAAVGWRDDRAGLPAAIKFCGQTVAVLLAMLLLTTGVTIDWWVWPISILGLLWAINLFNFMDGIDGFAISEAMFFALGGALVSTAQGTDMSLALAAACAGFALFNWPPARIFMGDVCSGFLGLVLGLIAWRAVCVGGSSIVPWLLLGGAFIVDATYTLLCRILTRQKWLEPHRSHAYQIASRRLGSHRAVTLCLNAINLFCLLPLAWLAVRWPGIDVYLVAFAYLPLLAVQYFLKAGRADLQ